MHSFQRIALLALPLLSSVLCDDPSTPTQSLRPVYADANQAFQDLLNALPEESLHVALNSLENFKDGVFESDRHGVERVHHENPPLATKLIVAAVQDLKKRQAPAPSNGTNPPEQTANTPSQGPSSVETPSPPASSPPPPPSSSRDPGVIVPVPITTTNSAGQITVVSSSILSQPTASIAIPVTLTDAQGSTFISTTTKPAVIFTVTDSAGSAFETRSDVDFMPTAGQAITTTDAEGSTFVTTYTPGGGRVSSILLITTTGDDGKAKVVTSYTFVEPMQTGTDGQPVPTTSSTARPGLQPGAAGRTQNSLWAVLGGAALALWI